MDSFYRKLPFTLAALCLSVKFGCGISEAQQEEIKIPDSPPQITITLRSDFIFEQPLEPDPQINRSAEKVQFFWKKKIGAEGLKKPTLSTFKTDEGYQSIERFEGVSPETFETGVEKKPMPSKKTIRNTVKLQDKSLILGGRGFNIQVFDEDSDLSLDYTSHLREHAKYTPNISPEDHLDLAGEYSKHTKGLIYGETRAAFGKMPPPLAKANAVESQAQVSIPVEKNPNSLLVLPSVGESIAVVSRDKKPLDLLTGSENLNKKNFRSE